MAVRTVARCMGATQAHLLQRSPPAQFRRSTSAGDDHQSGTQAPEALDVTPAANRRAVALRVAITQNTTPKEEPPMPALARPAAEKPMFPQYNRFAELKDMAAFLDNRRCDGDALDFWTVEELDSFSTDPDPDPGAHELYSIGGLRPFADAIAWWQYAMETALKVQYGSFVQSGGNTDGHPAEDEFIDASAKALTAYSEAISEAIRNTRGGPPHDSLTKAIQLVVGYRGFTRTAAGILSRLLPELSIEALLQIP